MRNINEKYAPMLRDRETGEILTPGEVARKENCPLSVPPIDTRTPEERYADWLKKKKLDRKFSPAANTSDFASFLIAMLPGEVGMPLRGRYLPEIDLKHVVRLAVLATYLPISGITKQKPIFNEGGTAPMTRAEMQDILQLETREFRCFLSAAKEADYLSEKDGAFYLSKDFHRGKLRRKKMQNINIVNTHMLRQLYTATVNCKNKFARRSIGSIIALLPYIQKQRNVLCMNPYAGPNESVQYMTDRDICRVLGYGEHNAERTVAAIMRDVQACSVKTRGRKQYLMIKTVKNGQTVYVVNPNVIYVGQMAQDVRKSYNFDAS